MCQEKAGICPRIPAVAVLKEDGTEHKSDTVRLPTAGEEEKFCRSGWLRLGDVENAGKIDHNDIDQILAALHGEDVGNIDADLNENGIVDTADLQIAVQSLYFYDESEGKKPVSTVEK